MLYRNLEWWLWIVQMWMQPVGVTQAIHTCTRSKYVDQLVVPCVESRVDGASIWGGLVRCRETSESRWRDRGGVTEPRKLGCGAALPQTGLIVCHHSAVHFSILFPVPTQLLNRRKLLLASLNLRTMPNQPGIEPRPKNILRFVFMKNIKLRDSAACAS